MGVAVVAVLRAGVRGVLAVRWFLSSAVAIGRPLRKSARSSSLSFFGS